MSEQESRDLDYDQVDPYPEEGYPRQGTPPLVWILLGMGLALGLLLYYTTR